MHRFTKIGLTSLKSAPHRLFSGSYINVAHAFVSPASKMAIEGLGRPTEEP